MPVQRHSLFVLADNHLYQYRCNCIISPELYRVSRGASRRPRSSISTLRDRFANPIIFEKSLYFPSSLSSLAPVPPHGHGNHHSAVFHGWSCWLNSLRPKPPFSSRTFTPPDPNLEPNLDPQPRALPHFRQLSSVSSPGSGWRQQLRRLSP